MSPLKRSIHIQLSAGYKCKALLLLNYTNPGSIKFVSAKVEELHIGNRYTGVS